MEFCANYDGVCWWCLHAAEGRIYWGVPIGVSRDHVIQVQGYFCSPACALAYINNNISSENTAAQARELLFVQLRVNWRRELLRPAPPQSDLKMFGGSLTIEQFRGHGGLKQLPVSSSSLVKRRSVAVLARQPGSHMLKTERVAKRLGFTIKLHV